MGGPSFRQYFGPSARHPRACTEILFQPDGRPRRLGPYGPLLQKLGFKTLEPLPDKVASLEEAVCTIAGVILSLHHRRWWRSHGTDGACGWAAIAHPIPNFAASALAIAHHVLTSRDPRSLRLDTVRAYAAELQSFSAMRLELLIAAEQSGCSTATLNCTSEIFQIGQGAKGIHFLRSGSEADSFTGYVLERSKHVTIDTLRRFGLPTAASVVVTKEAEIGPAVERVGLPCVVKPLGLNRGIGVSTYLQSFPQVEAAFTQAHKQSDENAPVLIERHVEGDDHRIMVTGDQLLWVYRRTPAAVVGDGSATIGQLIQRENDRRAAIFEGPEAYLYKIETGEELSRLLRDRYGLTPGDVLANGRRIEVVGQANTARGGLREDVTGITHPDNRALALRIARLFRLGTTGIDFLTTDISRSWKEGGCALIEVNRVPSFSGAGDAALLFRAKFPKRRSGRIPTVTIIGTAAYRASVSKTVEAVFRRHGLHVVTTDHLPGGSGSPDGILDSAGPTTVETALLDKDADAIVLRCATEQVDQFGMPLARSDVLFTEDTSPRPWLEGGAQEIFIGSPAVEEIERAANELALLHADPDEGGPLPVLDLVPSASEGEFRLRAWRAPALPRAVFWQEVGVESPAGPAGLTTPADHFAAVHALAQLELGDGAEPLLPFVYGDLAAPWSKTSFEGTMTLPEENRDAARAALKGAINRVNRIAAMKIK